MEISSEEAYSILGIVGGSEGAIISKSGVITILFKLEQPEAYSLDADNLELGHKKFYQAFKNLPDGTFVHKQDVFLKKKYTSAEPKDSFIDKAEDRHFEGRLYLDHTCVLAFSLTEIDGLDKSYISNPLQYKEHLTKKGKEDISNFIEEVNGAVNVIKNIYSTTIKQMNEQEIKDYIYDYCNGFSGDDGMRDIHFAEGLTIGENKGVVFSISDENYLPGEINTSVEDNTLPISITSLYMSELEALGVHLLCNHIYNQIIWFQGNNQLKDALETRVTLFGQHKKFSSSIEIKHGKLLEMKQEVFNEESLLVRAGFNFILWDNDKDVLDKAVDKVKEILNVNKFKYYIPSYDGLQNIWIGSIIGRENKLHKDYLFLTDLNVALCLFTNRSTFKNDEEGILFNDRIFQVPLRKDIWDAKKKRIPARNAIVMASTGGGKSATTLNIVQQMIEQKYKVIVCEFGKSFEQLARLYPDISLHIDYDGESPLGINPFFLDGEELTLDKIKTLVKIILKFWRSKEIREDAKQVVSLTMIVRDYYERVKEHHSFPNFYTFLKENWKDIQTRHSIEDEYFDYKGFLHICSDFMPGGIYENVCKVGEYEESIKNKSFIVFELTKIKKDPFLAALIMSILFDTIENKILSDKSTRGMLIFDEYAETQAMVDIYSGDDVHSTVAFCYQKLRKENGGIMTIIQSPAQLPDNNYTKGILSNTQLLYVLPTSELVYSQIIKAFEINDPKQINLMKSIRNDFSGSKPYSEIYIRFLDLYNIAVRLEFSREKFFAFQTDGEDWEAINELFHENKNMEKAIDEYIKIKK